jgi:ADP-heptose:LPS heptosyltransferase
VVDIRASAMGYIVPTWRRAVMRKSTGHKTEQLARILRVRPAPLPVVWTSPTDRAVAERLLPAGPPILALGPTANWTGKVWPSERFAALAAELAPSLPRVAVFAGPGPFEAGLAAPLLAALPDAIDLTGRLTLSEAAACLARCALFVGNDSGLMHMAAAAGTATIGLFGPTPAAEYGPAGRSATPVISPTGRMEDLATPLVASAAQTLLSTTPAEQY